VSGHPPRLAEWLVAHTLGDDDRDAVLGDLHEEFCAQALTYGRPAAGRWFWRQAISSVIPNLRRRIRSGQPYRATPPRSSAMSSFFQDIRISLRLLGRRPGVAIVAGLSMAAGISLTSIVFSLLDAAVLRPLPVADPDRLVVVLAQRETGVNHNFSYPDFVDYREGRRVFADLSGSGGATATVRTPAGAINVEGELVSGSYFSMLGVPVRAGRPLNDGDVAPGAPPVVVVSEFLWRDLAGPNAPFDGRTAIVNGQAFAIVGIAGRRFHGIQVGRDVRLWAPVSQQVILDPRGGESYWDRRTASWLTVIGRLNPDISVDEAAADLNRIESALGPAVNRQEKRTLILAPGQQGDSMLPQATAEPLQLLFGAALLVLLVAAANVANLLAARASDRRRELAVRTALGAGRGRLVRLLVTEALLIGAGSSAVALAATGLLAGVVAPLLPGLADPESLDVGVTWRVAGFVAAIGLVTTVVSSLFPIARIWRGTTGQMLADAGRSASAAPGSQRIRRVLVVAQFALSLALVVTAALLIRTLFNVRAIPTGLHVDRVALLEVDPEAAGYDAPRVRQYYAAALARLAATPGVRATGYGRVIPIGFGGSRVTLDIPGYVPGPDEDMEINYNVVSPGYFDTVGVALAAGRWPTDRDVLGLPVVAIINESMARRYWPSGAAIGRTFRFGGPDGPAFEVIGIARDVKYRTLREEAAPSFYYSIHQSQRPRAGALHVRTDGDPESLLASLRRTLADVDPAVPITVVRTLRDQRNRNAAEEELAMTIGAVLGAVALGLAAVGLFAAMSASVGRRTREIGVRMALGAHPSRIVSLVLRDSLRLVLVGAGLGLALAFWIGRFVQERLYGISPYDPASFAAAVLVLAGVALLAGWAPARRAALVDPIEALRSE
jgi:predicted permease